MNVYKNLSSIRIFITIGGFTKFWKWMGRSGNGSAQKMVSIISRTILPNYIIINTNIKLWINRRIEHSLISSWWRWHNWFFKRKGLQRFGDVKNFPTMVLVGITSLDNMRILHNLSGFSVKLFQKLSHSNKFYR